MKPFGIAILLALIALCGIGGASAYDDPPTTDPDPVQTP